MNVVAFVISGILFLGSFLAFGYAFVIEGTAGAALFAAGVLAVGASLAIPFHVIGYGEKS